MKGKLTFIFLLRWSGPEPLLGGHRDVEYFVFRRDGDPGHNVGVGGDGNPGHNVGHPRRTCRQHLRP